MVVDTYRKRRASVSKNFTPYTFAEKRNQRDALKNPFDTKNLQTAIAETEHTITTDKNRVLHKKLISCPIDFQPQKKKSNEEEAATRRGWNKCRQSGKFCRCCDCEACSEARDKGLIAPPRQSGSSSSTLTAIEGEKTTDKSPTKASTAQEDTQDIPATGEITPNLPPPTMTSTKRIVRIKRDNILKMPKLDETMEETATESDSDTSYHTRDAEVTDETMASSSSGSPETTVPESELTTTANAEETLPAEENTGGSIHPVRRSCRTH